MKSIASIEKPGDIIVCNGSYAEVSIKSRQTFDTGFYNLGSNLVEGHFDLTSSRHDVPSLGSIDEECRS
jgi:hypothetical protein